MYGRFVIASINAPTTRGFMKRFLSFCFIAFFAAAFTFSQAFNISNDDWSKSGGAFGFENSDAPASSFETPETEDDWGEADEDWGETEEEEEKKATGLNVTDFELNSYGDQNIQIALAGNYALAPYNLFWGGNISLGYNFFIDSLFSIGGNVNFNYHKTRGNNVFYNVPFMAKGTINLAVGRYEIPISLSAGFALQSYLTRFYFGPIAKPEIGFFYRTNSDWSVGVTLGAYMIPQYYIGHSENNRFGTTVEAGLSIRYHF